MPKQKYKQKPMFWYCIQYNGSNVEEMTTFCPLVTYDVGEQKLMFASVNVINPSSWVLQDNSDSFSVMDNERFVDFFDLAP